MHARQLPIPDSLATTHLPPPALHYFPSIQSSRRRLLRRLAVALIFTAFAFVLIWNRVPLLAHARLLHAQRACRNFTLPPTSIVASYGSHSNLIAPPVPGCWSSFEAAALKPLTLSPLPQTFAFLHGRRSPAGHDRIVAVRCIPVYLGAPRVLQAFQAIVAEPASLWPLSSRPVLHEARFPGGYPLALSVNVFAGQPDPADPAHFTIAYTVNDTPGVIDATLKDDDTIDLKIRPGSPDVISAWNAARKDAAPDNLSPPTDPRGTRPTTAR